MKTKLMWAPQSLRTRAMLALGRAPNAWKLVVALVLSAAALSALQVRGRKTRHNHAKPALDPLPSRTANLNGR